MSTDAEPAAERIDGVKEAEPKERVNILLVDDLPEKLLALRVVLEQLDETLVLANSGRQALRHLLERDFAVILLDVNMPDMDGFETAQLIRRRKRSEHTPIIFLTAFGDEMNTLQGYSLGAVDYILTPAVPEILRTKVGVFVDLFRKREEVRRTAEHRVALAREQTARALAEEATRRTAFLAEATARLSRSLDLETTLEALISVLVPRLGRSATVVTLDEHGGLSTVRRAGTDAAGRHTSRTLDSLAALGRCAEEAMHLALAEGTPTVLGCDDEEGRGATIILPLVAQRRVLGAVEVVRGPGEPEHTVAERALLEDVVSRAAIALDNAFLHHEIKRSDQRKNEFLAMLAHELRNPLAPIQNAAEILRMENRTDASVDAARGIIDRQVKQMVRLIDDLLDVSRITSGKVRLQLRPVDVASVVAIALETSRPLIDARHHTVESSIEPGLHVHGDPTRLAQVIANLLNNAAKYTEDGGFISVDVRAEGGKVAIRVRDSGVGIPREMLRQVFDLFAQVNRSLDRSQGGLGLGLTLVHRLVELHGGSVEALSEGVGRGSEFVVRLPRLAELPAQSSPREAEHRPPPPRGLARVLVVDDNTDAAAMLASLLELLGHEVHVSHDGPTALTVVEHMRPHLVLLDIGLPGMDGYEVARRLRAQAPLRPPKLVAVTGYGQPDDVLRARAAGIDHHVVKPVSYERLMELLQDVRPEHATG